MEAADHQKGHEASQKRSPLDLIINQFRRKTSFTERKKPPMGRLFRSSESSDKKNSGIPEAKETGIIEGKESIESGTDTNDGDPEVCSVVGWGRVKQFVQKLGKTPDSQSLSLSHCDLTATDIVELGALLPFLTQLEVMDLSWNDLLGGSLKALTVHLQHVCKLKVLKLSSCRLTAQDVSALGEALEIVPMLEMLDLSWNSGIGAGNLHFLTKHLCSSSSLRELNLIDCQLSVEDATALGKALVSLPRLEVLDLSNNKLLVTAVENIASSLISISHLRTLKLSMCGLDQDSLAILGEKIAFLSKLEHLDLSCNKKSGGGFSAVAVSLSLLTHLKCLDLHLCCLKEDDVLALVQVVSAMSELTELDLSSNKSVGTVLQTLLPALPLSKIKKLDLNNCALSPEACHALATAMPSLVQLENINLSWNKSVGENLQRLLGPLQANGKLEQLTLSSCDLTAEDMLHLESACKRGALSHLMRLDLSYNGRVGDDGWISLFREAGSLKELHELDISLRPRTSLSATPWLYAMIEALPQLLSLRRLALQRWSIGPKEREKLEKSLSKRNIVLECDEVAFLAQKAG